MGGAGRDMLLEQVLEQVEVDEVEVVDATAVHPVVGEGGQKRSWWWC